MSEIKIAGSGGERYVPYGERKGNESIVYFTRDLSPEGLRKLYRRVNGQICGKIAVKLHTGEQYGPNIIPSTWIKELMATDLPDATIVETNTFYEGITIDGIDVSGKTKEEVINLFAQTTKTNAEDILNIQFQVGEDLVPLDVSGLSVTSNINEVIEKAYAYGRTSTLSGNDGLKDRYNTINSLKAMPLTVTATGAGNAGTTTVAIERLEDYQVELMSTSALAQESTDEEVEREMRRLAEGDNGVVGDEAPRRAPERREPRKDGGKPREKRQGKPQGERQENRERRNNKPKTGDQPRRSGGGRDRRN